MSYKVNKQNCRGCGRCATNCPGAISIGSDGKAEVIDQKKLEQCGGESVCPFGAIERTGEKEENELNAPTQKSTSLPYGPPPGGRGMGRGMGAGRGRGFGMGPRDGRGKGLGAGRGRGFNRP